MHACKQSTGVQCKPSLTSCDVPRCKQYIVTTTVLDVTEQGKTDACALGTQVAVKREGRESDNNAKPYYLGAETINGTGTLRIWIKLLFL